MELALTDDDEHATLAAALALVDDDEESQVGTCPQETLLLHTKPSVQAHKTQRHLALPPAQAPADPWAQRSTRDRKRQRKEIVRLRDEVAGLEAYVTQLQKFFAGNSTDRGAQGCGSQRFQEHEAADRTKWFSTAVAECKKLQRAKQWNQDLKAALDEEREVSLALIKIFEQQLSKETLEYLTALEKQHTQEQEEREDKVTSSLSQMLPQLKKIHATMHERLAQINTRNTRSVFHTSHSEHDPEHGPSHEFNTNTPASCNYRQLEKFLWQQIATSVGLDCRKPSHSSLEMPRVKKELSNCHQRHMSFGFSESIEGRSMDGMFTVRKFTEKNRVVFALASEITFSGSTLVIREDAWILLTDVTPNSPSAGSSGGDSASSHANSKTLLQTHYRTYVETQDPNMTQEMEQLRDFVMKFKVEKIKKYQLHMQDVLIRDCNAIHRREYQYEMNPDCIACGFQVSRFQKQTPRARA